MPTSIGQRPDPEKLLRQVQAEESLGRRGRLKVFLGYASGVGKSFRMFDEGRRRKQRGEDVLVGAVQPNASEEVNQILARLEVIPNSDLIDVDTILARRPGVCLVDGLAYDNPPGSPRARRWQDVEALLDAGISVITSINLQFIEEYRERVEQITGKRVTQTVPVSFLQGADEIEVVDAPPEEALHRVGRGTLLNAAQLAELREIALLLAADVVDRQLVSYMERHGVQASWGTQERILVCLTPRANATKLMASARRNADRFHGELFAAYVTQPEISPNDQAALERNLATARDAGAEVVMLDGEDPAEVILKFARERGITQIFVGHSRREGWFNRFTRTPVDRLLDGAENMDVRVFPH